MRIVDAPAEWHPWLRIVADVSAGDLDCHLTGPERDEICVLRLPERQLERAASRIAGKLLLVESLRLGSAAEIAFEKEGDRPLARLQASSRTVCVSFSHSHGIGAAAAADGPVGVDLERFRDIRPEMTRFFLSPSELSAAGSLSIQRPLLHFWSAKEAAFKMAGSFPTLLKTPLRVIEATSSGLTFEVEGMNALVETRIVEATFVAALARTRSV